MFTIHLRGFSKTQPRKDRGVYEGITKIESERLKRVQRRFLGRGRNGPGGLKVSRRKTAFFGRCWCCKQKSPVALTSCFFFSFRLLPRVSCWIGGLEKEYKRDRKQEMRFKWRYEIRMTVEKSRGFRCAEWLGGVPRGRSGNRKEVKNRRRRSREGSLGAKKYKV